MDKVLIFRERILKFFASNERMIRLFSRFLGGALLFYVARQIYGYNDILSQAAAIAILGLVCTFLPTSIIFLIYQLTIAAYLAGVSAEIGVLYLILIGVYYLLYQRLFIDTEILFLMTPVFFYFHIPAALPIFVGSFVGLNGLPAILAGTVVYYSAGVLRDALIHSADLSNGGWASHLLINGTAGNKELLLCLTAFVLVTAIVAGIRKAWIAYGWYIAVFAGGGIYMFIMLIGGYFTNNRINILLELLMIIISMLVAAVVQFFSGVIDYTREERFEFEDEEYYYYVKAIPKVSMAEEENIKKVIVPARRFHLSRKAKHDDKGEES